MLYCSSSTRVYTTCLQFHFIIMLYKTIHLYINEFFKIDYNKDDFVLVFAGTEGSYY